MKSVKQKLDETVRYDESYETCLVTIGDKSICLMHAKCSSLDSFESAVNEALMHGKKFIKCVHPLQIESLGMGDLDFQQYSTYTVPEVNLDISNITSISHPIDSVALGYHQAVNRMDFIGEYPESSQEIMQKVVDRMSNEKKEQLDNGDFRKYILEQTDRLMKYTRGEISDSQYEAESKGLVFEEREPTDSELDSVGSADVIDLFKNMTPPDKVH